LQNKGFHLKTWNYQIREIRYLKRKRKQLSGKWCNELNMVRVLILILGDSNFCHTIGTSQYKGARLDGSFPSTLGKYRSYSDTYFSSRVRKFHILDSLQKIIIFIMQ